MTEAWSEAISDDTFFAGAVGITFFVAQYLLACQPFPLGLGRLAFRLVLCQ
jgi:hypothetical protein